jgi:Tol biopolymer transport system component
VLFPSSCRGEALPDPSIDAAPAGRSLNDRLKTDDAVAFSPDGSKVAFRGGDCEDVYDSCLTIGTVADGGEETVAAYGGGGLQDSGFAVVPSWRADGAKLAFTAYQQGETVAENQPVHLVEYDTATRTKRNVGGTLDREMAYVDAGRGVATGQYRNGSWILVVNLATGAETPFQAGSQPSVQPPQK